MNETLLLDTRPLARRSPLAASLLLHCVLVAILLFWPKDRSIESPARAAHKKTVLLVQLRDFDQRVKRLRGSPDQAHASGEGAGTAGANLHFEPRSTASESDSAHRADLTTPEQPRRRFEVPAMATNRAIRQTIIQVDVPPDVVLKQDIPLVNILSWTPQQTVTPFRKQFVAPPLKEIPKEVAQNLPPTPDIKLPNREVTLSDLKLAAALTETTPRLIRPPATTAPVRMPKPDSVNQVPQIAAAEPNAANAAALIALVENPVRPDRLIIVPPANQIAPAGPSGQGARQGGRNGDGQGVQERRNTGAGAGDGKTGSNASGAGVLAAGQEGGAGIGRGGSNNGNDAGPGSTSGTGNEPGGTPSGRGSAAAGSGAGAADSGGAASTGGNGSGLDTAGLTRISLPKDGTFGVVVLGSSQATPYPETVGALSGKMIYTVYLGVGLHKKWILQYCLTKAAERTAPRGSATPVDAPWPFLIFRPDALSGSNDYVIVHGMIDTEGRFDQLTMVFPDQFDQRDLLINSLKLWAFRPASRDREPTAVEVLLIIPTES